MKTIDEERKAIIEDAKAAGIILGSLSGSEIFEKIVENLTKFAQLQAARNQSNNVPVAGANYVAYLYFDRNGTLKLSQEAPPPPKAFPVFRTDINFLDVARVVLEDCADLIIQHGELKLWHALVEKINKDYAK